MTDNENKVIEDTADLIAALTDENYRHEMQHLRSSGDIDRLLQQSASVINSLLMNIGVMEKELAVRHRAQPYTYIGIDGKSVLARKLEDDLIAAKEDRRELLMAIENIARMTEQGVFSAEREQAAMEMRSLVPSRFRATEQEPT